jgi:hypothetical protein
MLNFSLNKVIFAECFFEPIKVIGAPVIEFAVGFNLLHIFVRSDSIMRIARTWL